jgi:acetyl-CoA carboxylase biotin carboxyl carrier protein
MKERRSKVKAVAEPVDKTLPQVVEELAEILRRQDLSELSIETEGFMVQLKRGGAHVVAAPVVAPVAAVAAAPAAPAPASHAATSKAETSDGNVSYITSPFVGTFYRSPGPDAAPFVDVGTRFKKGHVLCIVEAMKLMNEIEAEIEGTVVQVLVENGHPVEYGEPLFKIKQG